jgi:hypothetical protein
MEGCRDWISSHVAAKILGMHESGFRRRYCRQDAPKVATLENGQVGNKRRFKVLRDDIERLKSERCAAEY